MKNRHHVAVIGFLAAFSGTAAPSSDEIDRAVREMESREFSVRDGAFQRLREWGKEDPGKVTGRLPERSEDPEVRSRCQALRQELNPSSWERLRREILEGADERPGAGGNMMTLTGPFGMTFPQAVNDLFDNPAPLKLGPLRSWTGTQDPRLAKIAKAFIVHEDPDFRLNALFLATDLEDPSLAPLVARFLADPQPVARRAAFRALVRWKDAAARKALSALLMDEDPDTRESAAEAARDVEPDRAAELLAARIHLETDPYVMTMLLRKVPLSSVVPAHAPALAQVLLDPDLYADDEALQVVSAALLRLAGNPPGTGRPITDARAWWERHKDDPMYRTDEARRESR